MKTKKGTYTPPPEPVYKTSKRKERCAKAINLVKLLISDADSEDYMRTHNLIEALAHLEIYKNRLTEF